MDPIAIIQKFYKTDSKVYQLLIPHSQAVTQKALAIAKSLSHLNPDLQFIEEAAMLHDIGIFMTDCPELGCFGDKKYICHGYLGRELLEKEGFPNHGLVCERHTGMGLSVYDIENEKLPLPKRDMLPVSLEEKIICLADKFFSKDAASLTTEKDIETIKKDHAGFGQHILERFQNLLRELKQ